MFYSGQILSKGGPLQLIWLASHSDRIERSKVAQTSIPTCVESIIRPQAGGAAVSHALTFLMLARAEHTVSCMSK
jgi:hypothetical protein